MTMYADILRSSQRTGEIRLWEAVVLSIRQYGSFFCLPERIFFEIRFVKTASQRYINAGIIVLSERWIYYDFCGNEFDS